MDLHIKSEFECVYLINGEFSETADCMKMMDHDVVYVTALPLKPTLLPYTVKLCGAENITTELASGMRLDGDNYLLVLSPRYMTVYTVSQSAPPQGSNISRLFSLVKSGDVAAAHAMLSETLKDSIDRDDLAAFFSGYEKIAECSWEPGNKFYLIDKNGASRLHSYTVKDGFIDDIIEME